MLTNLEQQHKKTHSTQSTGKNRKGWLRGPEVLPFLDIKLIKKPKTQKEFLILPLLCPTDSNRNTCLGKKSLRIHLSLIWVRVTDRKVSSRGMFTRLLCPVVSRLSSINLPARYVELLLNLSFSLLKSKIPVLPFLLYPKGHIFPMWPVFGIFILMWIRHAQVNVIFCC